MNVRFAGLSDARAIAEIRVRTWQHAYRGQMPEAFLAALSIDDRLPMWKDILSAPREDAPILVAVEDGQVIGFCSAGKCRDDDATGETGEVYAIYMAPEHMGRGAGSALMSRACEELARVGFTEATLWVLETNVKARAFYEHAGWTFDGGRKVEPKDGFEFREVRYRVSILRHAVHQAHDHGV